MAPQLNEYILDNVLRGRTLPDNTQRSTIDGWRQAVEDFSESMVVTGCQARRQQRVRPPHAWTLARHTATGKGSPWLQWRVWRPARRAWRPSDISPLVRMTVYRVAI